MSLQQLVPWLIGAMVISIAAMVSGVWSGIPFMVTCGALLFAMALIATSWQINRPLMLLRADDDISHETLQHSVRRNARLIALVYVWGALGMLLLYQWTGLRWQHGLQYAFGMAAIGTLIFVWVHRSVQPGSRLVTPAALALALKGTLVHAVAALGGLVFLIGSGKIMSVRSDWAANRLFLAGGVAVVGLSVIGIWAHLHLTRAMAHRTATASHTSAGEHQG